VAVGLIALWIGASNDEDPYGSSFTSFSAGKYGSKALWLLLEQLDVPVEHFRRPPARLPAAESTTLAIINPTARVITKKEATALKSWMEKGNDVTLALGRPRALMPVNEDLKYWATQMSAKEFDLSLEFARKYEKEQNEAKKTLANVQIPGAPEPLTLRLDSGTRWSSPSKEWKVILEDDFGPIILKREYGEGSLTAVSEPELFSNKGIDREQNSRVALALLMPRGKKSPVLFDEFHHGFRLDESMSEFIADSVFAWALLQIALGTLLFFYSRRAVYAGKPSTLLRPSGRSTMEYVGSMANVLEIARARGPALEMVLDRFLNRVAGRTGFPVQSITDPEIMRELEARFAFPVALITGCRYAIAHGAEPETYIRLAAEITEAENTFFHPGRKSGASTG
jgi:hypothetical protein